MATLRYQDSPSCRGSVPVCASLTALSLTLVLCGNPVEARQQNNFPPPRNPLNSGTAPRQGAAWLRDPKALQLLSEVRATYAKLSTVSCEYQIEGVRTVRTLNLAGRLSADRGQGRIFLGLNSQVDGASTVAYNIYDGSSHLRVNPTPAGSTLRASRYPSKIARFSVMPVVMALGLTPVCSLVYFLDNLEIPELKNPNFSILPGQAPQPRVDTIAFGPDESLDGVSVQVIQVKFKNSPQLQEIRYYIGKADKLLHQVIRVTPRGPGEEPALLRERYRNYRMEVTLNDFQLPQGVQVVDGKVPPGAAGSMPDKTTPPATKPATGSATSVDMGLHFVPSASTQLSQPNQGVFQFGKIKTIEQQIIRQKIKFKNDSPNPLRIIRANVSCPCLSVLSPKLPGPEVAPTPTSSSALQKPPPSLVVEPGKEIEVEFQVDLNLAAFGAMSSKFIFLWAEGVAAPVATLEVRGESIPPVRFSVASLDIGAAKVTAKNLKTHKVTAIIDKRLCPDGTVPPLASLSRALEVSVPRPAATNTSDSTDLALEYTVSIAKDAPLGLVNGALAYFPTQEQATPKKGPYWDQRVSTIMLPVVGEVSGEVDFSPKLVNFGVVKSGEGAVRRVTLTGISPAQLAGARIASGSPFLLLSLQPGTAKKGAGGREIGVLEISLSPDTPVNTLQTEVMVVLKNGRRIVLPINGLVNVSTQ